MKLIKWKLPYSVLIGGLHIVFIFSYFENKPFIESWASMITLIYVIIGVISIWLLNNGKKHFYHFSMLILLLFSLVFPNLILPTQRLELDGLLFVPTQLAVYVAFVYSFFQSGKVVFDNYKARKIVRLQNK